MVSVQFYDIEQNIEQKKIHLFLFQFTNNKLKEIIHEKYKLKMVNKVMKK